MSFEAHGGLNPAEMRAAGFDPAEVLDFSTNVNPFGAPPGVRAALAAIELRRYPDPQAAELRQSLAEANAVSPAQVLVGNGTAELIWLVVHALLRRGDPVLIPRPTFGEYERAARAVGAHVIDFPTAAPDYQIDVARLIAEIKRQRPAVVFLCNPNNPTGQVFAPEEIAQIAAACQPGLLVVDEAYHSFLTLTPFSQPLLGNVIVLRSMTKDFSIAGLRLGYALAEAQTIAALSAFQPPWSVNTSAQAAGLAALGELATVRDTLARTRQAARDLRAALHASGARINDPAAHFFLIHVGDAAQWRAQLLQHRILVRNCASFGLPEHVRIGTRQPHDNRRLLEAWAHVQQSQLSLEVSS